VKNGDKLIKTAGKVRFLGPRHGGKARGAGGKPLVRNQNGCNASQRTAPGGIAQGGGVAVRPEVPTDDWFGCYSGSWSGIAPEASNVHPAKYAHNLIARVYEHALTNGWIAKNDLILDVFGGVARGSFHAMKHGLRWVGIELEQKFCDLGNASIAEWTKRFSILPDWGTATLLQGDSRNLRSVLAVAGTVASVVSSPPYSEGGQGFGTDLHPERSNGMRNAKSAKTGNSFRGGYGASAGQMGRMAEGEAPACALASPPYAAGTTGHGVGIDFSKAKEGGKRTTPARQSCGDKYGNHKAQLGEMPEGTTPNLAVSSPPYAEIAAGAGGLNHKPAKHSGQQAGRKRGASQSADQRYGKSDGQLSKLREGAAPGCAVGSPPFMGSLMTKDTKFANRVAHDRRNGSRLQNSFDGYGVTAGNIGNMDSETFWGASKIILQELYAVLKPGAHTIWILGNFVRKGHVVEFDRQWEALCVEVGFVPVCRHIAHKTEHHGTQALLEGGEHHIKTSRISFFRRLAIKKNPGAAVTSETVLCFRKPL
jgi:hypothetical protein